jgi:hypothetical protein
MAGKFRKGSSPEFETSLKGPPSFVRPKSKETSPSQGKIEVRSFQLALEQKLGIYSIVHSLEPIDQRHSCHTSRASRSHSCSSDRLSLDEFGKSPSPPKPPEPAFIAIAAALQIIACEHDTLANIRFDRYRITPSRETALIVPSILKLVNQFLDHLLLDLLTISKSTSLGSLHSAITEVLGPKLAKDAISGADQELSESLFDKVSQDEESELEPSSDWNVELVWKHVRLKCMVYSSLGDMEEEDEDRSTNQEQIFVVSPVVAIFLTSILEYMGEQILLVAAQAAYHRSRAKHEQEEGINATSKIPNCIVLEEADLERVALDRTLGWLWRKLTKRIHQVTVPTGCRDESSNKPKMLSRWQKAFQTTPLWDPDDSWKETEVHQKLMPLEAKHWEDTIRMIRECRKQDPFFLTIHDIYFGGIWFNKEVIRMIVRTSILLSVTSVYPAAGPVTRTFDATEESASPDSKADENDYGTTEYEESYDSTSSGTRELVDESLIQPLIVATKQKLIDRLMEHFWVLLEQMQNTNIVGHASETSSAGAKTASSSTTSSTELSSLKSSKRRLSNDNGADSEEGDQNRCTPPRKSSAVSDQTKSHRGFACPYRKHNPRKYNIDGWRPCALTPHNTIARVK